MKYLANGKAMINLLTVGLIEKIFFQNHMPEVKTKYLDLPNYAMQSDLKIATGVNRSKFTKKFGFRNFYIGLDISKLKTTLAFLIKLSNVIEDDIVKKTVCYELVKNVNANQIIDTSDLVAKADNNTKIDEIKTEIPALDK